MTSGDNMRDGSVHSGFFAARINNAEKETDCQHVVNSYAARVIQAVGR